MQSGRFFCLIISALHEKSQEAAVDIINELLDGLEIELSRKSNENFIREILDAVTRGLSMRELVDEIIRRLPIEPDKDQWSLIEFSAEQLWVIGEPDVTEEYSIAREVMEEIVDEVLLMKGKPKTVIARMLMQLVQQVPYEIIRERSSLEYIAGRLSQVKVDEKIGVDEVANLLATQEAKDLLDEMLEQVYDTGLDLIFVIKDD